MCAWKVLSSWDPFEIDHHYYCAGNWQGSYEHQFNALGMTRKGDDLDPMYEIGGQCLNQLPHQSHNKLLNDPPHLVS